MKKTMLMILAAVMCMGMSVAALAQAPTTQDDSKQYNGPVCECCKIGEMRPYGSALPWELVDYAACHLEDDTHTDKVYKQVVRKGVKCSYCGLADLTISIETKFVCQG